MRIPPHRRKRSPWDGQVLGIRVRRDKPVFDLTEARRYFLGQIAAEAVKWSQRGGRGHWRCDETDVSRTVEQLVAAGWVHVSGTARSKQRTVSLTNVGKELLTMD